MKHRNVLIFILLVAIILVAYLVSFEASKYIIPSSPIPFFGVEYAYGNSTDPNIGCEALVDKVCNCTNLFVLGNPDITQNETLLNQTCDYIVSKGLSFIVFFSAPSTYTYNILSWISDARLKYGDKFLGVYRIDEPGGKQIDDVPTEAFVPNTTYANDSVEAAEAFNYGVSAHLEPFLEVSPRVVTSDYALYWFDYLGGYSAVFTEYGFNFSRPLVTALCKSAAVVQDKQWGVTVTWTYESAPYIESPDALYNDLVYAYNAGAPYILIFDYPMITSYGILTEQHFEAMQKFWNYLQNNPRTSRPNQQVAYVLPYDYGFGFGSPNDTIWGLWPADELSATIWENVTSLLNTYGYNLGIVYTTHNTISLYKITIKH